MMGPEADTLYGNVPDKAPIALLIIDVINDLEFEDGESLLRHALPMAKQLAKLKKEAKSNGCATIYVNDNFGKWRSDFQTLVKHCLEDNVRGKPLVELLQPEKDDYFILKPAHSGFYSTTLDLLLNYLGSKTLIITGIATNICVLFTASDAFMRGYRVCVPDDCVAANTATLTEDSLEQMASVLQATIVESGSIPWQKWSTADSSGEQ